MVQLSPDTQNSYVDWAACAGYEYEDSSIIGFSHTHLSGTGIPELSDILFMPLTGKPIFSPGTSEDPDSGYRSRFSHDTEKASPGYYSVVLEDYNIKAELTATKRTGVHRYSFPKNTTTSILIDIAHRDPIMESSFEIVSETEIAGYRRSKAWAGDQRQYFVAKFSKPIISYTVEEDGVVKKTANYSGNKIIAVLNFDASGKQVIAEVALSAVSIENAWKNLATETSNFNFDKVVEDANTIWSLSLGKIEIEDDNEDKKTIFYTALYHSLLTPNLYSDVDGKYRGMDGKIHQSTDFNNYHVFSLWDTFRALHPLLTIIEPDITRDLVVSLQHKYEQSGELPMWELASNDTRCMIGYHAVSLMADAYLKGITNVDADKILEAMVQSANINRRGINYYTELGYVPTNKSSQSVSKTLEYAYDDWCIAQMAKKIGNETVYEEFSKRARFFENLYDKETKFMRPRYSNREWVKDFDPTKVGATYNFNFTEGNSYQYSLFVPHDIQNVINSVGGDAEFDKWLDNLFNQAAIEEKGDSDITGLIGQYAHGNEPSHHMAYLYNYAGKPWKTQERVHQILNEMYSTQPDGLCGNEDCGQMSAWYVLSAMGFYSVTPGSPEYVIGSPSFKKVTIHLDNGNHFVLEGKNASSENIYIQQATLNGETYNKSYLSHQTILNGGTLSFQMQHSPNKNWATAKESRPSSDTYKVVSIPYIASDFNTFIANKTVDLRTDTNQASIYYTLDGSSPSQESNKYEKPFDIYTSTTLKVKAFKEGYLSSYTTSIPLNKSTAVQGLNPSKLQQGLNYNYYEGVFRSVHDWTLDTPRTKGTTPIINLSKKQREEWFALEFSGYIDIPVDGIYNFEIAANDGAQLKIDGEELFESDGRKSADFTQKNDIILSKGLHKFEVKYFQCSDNIGLKIYWQGPHFKRQEIPSTSYFRKEVLITK
ncbi:MAG: GH92 family glycosyl hydrolase [Labilibaculum sp.]|nr:GH92 family glycosyl hydrolase [Labilibaculum sp.]